MNWTVKGQFSIYLFIEMSMLKQPKGHIEMKWSFVWNKTYILSK